jgi:hypothetical protein
MKVAGFILLFVVLLSGCSPKLSPLYRDYEVTADASHSQADVLDRIERGLHEAGWKLSGANKREPFGFERSV